MSLMLWGSEQLPTLYFMRTTQLLPHPFLEVAGVEEGEWPGEHSEEVASYHDQGHGVPQVEDYP